MSEELKVLIRRHLW